jgi:flagellar hook-associated protein 1 FlgK
VAGAEASTIKVSDTIKFDPSLIAAASVVGGAPGDGQNAAALAGLAETRILAGNSQTALEFHTSLLSRIGSETKRATAATEAREALVNSLQAQYDNQAGVSLDEEAVDVMRFQQMYTSATKLVQVADQMMAQIMQLVQ